MIQTQSKSSDALAKKARYAARRAQGLCVRCCAPAPGGATRCAPCTERENTRHSPWCDCGAQRVRGATTCRRCRYLDGNGPLQQDVIAELRIADWQTVTQLAMGLDAKINSVWSALRKLERIGRVRKSPGRPGQPERWVLTMAREVAA